VESQTCGVPVICSKWAADDELVIDGFNGFLIGVNWDKSKPSVSHVELAEKIRDFFLLPDERKNEMRVNALNFSKRYSREVVVPRLRKALTKRSKARGNKTYSWNDIKDRPIEEYPELFSDFIINYSDISSLSFYELYSMNIAAREKSDKFLRDNFVLFYKDT
jgi:glycosyltransferase involved in cell wall biosynthesis